MNKTAIKNFSIWARNKLISDIQFRAQLLGVLPDSIREPLPQSEKETQFFDIGTKDYAVVKGSDVYRREAFVEALRAKARKTDYATAYKTVIEKIAYTWFNRLIAIRFMEVNDYLPGQVRVLSSRMAGKAEPDIVSTPFESDLEFTAQEQETIMRLKDDNKLDDLFRMLFISQCHKLSEILPGLFAPKEKSIPPREFYELLLNINFTDRDGLVWHLVNDISERDFRVRTQEDDLRQIAEDIPEEEMPAGQVEIIGWLYQYYNTDPKNDVFAGLKKNKKIEADDIPAATQLFTPDWIVRYMVQNSLGRLWVEGHPDTKKRFMPLHNADGSVDVQEGRWNYYLEEAKQEPQVEAQLAVIREEYAQLQPQDIKVIDPCCGSGHIAVYLFDVLMQIYETQGWTQREAAQSIVQNNLYALDIDERAAQLAYFAVMMKARQYDRRFFTRGMQPHVYAIPEWDEETRKNWSAELKDLCNLLRDGKEYGSIIDMPEMDWASLRMEAERIADMEGQLSIDSVSEETRQKLRKLIDVGQVMAQKYDVVVTNPPYMGGSGMGAKLSKFVKDYYPDSKSDLFAVFIERCQDMTKQNGYQAMITQHAWMFLSSFERLRKKLMSMDTVNMAHFGARAFEEIGGEVVQTTSFVLQNSYISGNKGTYCRLIEPTSQQGKEDMFLRGENRYTAQQDNFAKIPGSPVAYWVSRHFINAFTKGVALSSFASPEQGMATADNNRFVRRWYEVDISKVSLNGLQRKWYPYNNGGGYRKWYGLNTDVVNWENCGEEIKSYPKAYVRNERDYFKPGITWNAVSSSDISVRSFGEGFIFSNAGMAIFSEPAVLNYLLGFINSAVAKNLLKAISPTLNFNAGSIASLPIIMDKEVMRMTASIVEKCISLTKQDWDSCETSWDFQCHPLIDVISRGGPFFERNGIDIAECYLLWKGECDERFNQLKTSEEELNRIFIDIYGLQDEVTPEVVNGDVSVRRADLGRDIRTLISYAVGCMFGRYSLDTPGLAYAGGIWDAGKYCTYLPDDDNCLPITDEDYGLKDDIVNRFVDFIRTVYGEETLETNLDFIAHSLGNKGDTSRDIIRNYFLNDFFRDHCAAYSVTGSGKRPVYWLFESGKINGFKALVYMHRWNADTVGNLRVEYLHRMQRVYEKEIERMQDTIDNSRDSREIAQATKRREKLVKQLKEARDYDAKIAHVALSRIAIDLDDGVKVNYEKVQKGPDGKTLGIMASL